MPNLQRKKRHPKLQLWGSKNGIPNHQTANGHVSISSFLRIQGRKAWPHRRQYCSLTAASVKWGAPHFPLVKEGWISDLYVMAFWVPYGEVDKLPLSYSDVYCKNTGGFKDFESTLGPYIQCDGLTMLYIPFLKVGGSTAEFPLKNLGMHNVPYDCGSHYLRQRHITVKSHWILGTSLKSNKETWTSSF